MQRNVKLYGTASCPQCQGAKKYLEGKSVSFEYIDVFKDEEGMNYLKRKGISKLPVTINGDRYVEGFVPSEIDELIEEGM